MKILFAASEMTPYAKTGGLGDVIGALPGTLSRLGHEVTCCLPFYRCVKEVCREQARGYKTAGGSTPLRIPLGDRVVTGEVLEMRRADGVRMLFVRCDEFFDREDLYGTDGDDYDDNAERFLFFSKAVAELASDARYRPEVVHCHDWQTALVPVLMKREKNERPQAGTTASETLAPPRIVKTVLTIHNMAFQGIFPGEKFPLTNLPEKLFTPAALEFYERMNLMKGGIVFADAITTVSRTYAKEIQTPENGFGLDGVLKTRADVLHGILNGVDYEQWNPATDEYIKQRYDRDDLAGKQACKADLLERLGLDGGLNDRNRDGRATSRKQGRSRHQVPVAGFVSRLTEQKGVEVLVDAIEDLVEAGVVLAMLGKGERKYEEMLLEAARRFPGRVAVEIALDEELAHLIQAGTDMLLVPSRFEPCGLTQLYALKYGTIPVVRATGGLEDTVAQFDERPQAGRSRHQQGTGFKFAMYESEALVESVRRAILLHNQPKKWQKLMRNAMACDFSWQASAKEYEDLYAAL